MVAYYLFCAWLLFQWSPLPLTSGSWNPSSTPCRARWSTPGGTLPDSSVQSPTSVSGRWVPDNATVTLGSREDSSLVMNTRTLTAQWLRKCSPPFSSFFSALSIRFSVTLICVFLFLYFLVNFFKFFLVRSAFLERKLQRMTGSIFYSIMALNGFYSLTQAHDRIRLQMCSLFIFLSLMLAFSSQ